MGSISAFQDEIKAFHNFVNRFAEDVFYVKSHQFCWVFTRRTRSLCRALQPEVKSSGTHHPMCVTAELSRTSKFAMSLPFDDTVREARFLFGYFRSVFSACRQIS